MLTLGSLINYSSCNSINNFQDEFLIEIDSMKKVRIKLT
jgi:hypothetical protein